MYGGKQNISTASFLLLLFAAVNSAEAENSGQQPIVNGVGTLSVEGAMMESPCSLEMTSRSQTVSLPPVGTGELQKPGDTGTPVAFYLRLNGCVRSAGTRINTHNGTVAWSARQPLISYTFLGPADALTSALFQVKGTSGIGLQLLDAQGNTLRPGEVSAPTFVSPGQGSLSFTAVPQRTPAVLSAGNYRTTIEFQLHYH